MSIVNSYCIQKLPISVIHINLEIYIKLKLNLKIKLRWFELCF